MFLITPLLLWLVSLSEVTAGVILDPALFLAPSPPLTPSRYALTAVEMWTETLEDRVAREAEDVSVLPLKRSKVKQTTTTTEEPTQQTTGGLTGEIESHLIDSQFPFEKYTKETADLTGETIESALAERPIPSNNNQNFYTNDARSSYYGLGGIHVPLSFSISGLYGSYGAGRPSLVASNYATAETNDSLMGLFGYGNNPKPALAGGGYNYNSMGAVNPRLRVYGSGGSGPSWSGWGNGKWGHYGKG